MTTEFRFKYGSPEVVSLFVGLFSSSAHIIDNLRDGYGLEMRIIYET